MYIDVNNNRTIEIIPDRNTNGNVTVYSMDEREYIEREDHFTGGEIVMALNLLRYMKDHNMKRVFLANGKIEKQLIRDQDVEDFQIFG